MSIFIRKNGETFYVFISLKLMSGIVNAQYYVFFFICIECVTLSFPIKVALVLSTNALTCEHRLCNLHNMAKLCEGGKSYVC